MRKGLKLPAGDRREELGGIKEKKNARCGQKIMAGMKTLCSGKHKRSPQSKSGRRGNTSVSSSSFHDLLIESGDLPASYGTTTVVLIPVDPFLVNVFWEISPADLGRMRRFASSFPKHPESVLRFYDVTDMRRKNKRPYPFFDIPVNPDAGNWYVHLWSGGRSYYVELGLKTTKGKFLTICRSNTAEVPSSHPYFISKERYMLVADDYDIMKTVLLRTSESASEDVNSSPERDRSLDPISPCTHKLTTKFQTEKADLNKLTELSFSFGISSGRYLEGDGPDGGD